MNKEVIKPGQDINAQITKVKNELAQATDPGEIKRLRKQLHKLQINQLLELDKMEWYVEIDGIGRFGKC